MPANDPELYGSTTKQLLVGFDIQMLKEMHARQEKEDAEKAAEDPKVNKSPAATDNAPDKDAGEETGEETGGEEPEDNPSEDTVNEDSEDSDTSEEPDEPADEDTDTETDTAPAKPKAMFNEKTGKSEAPHSMDNIWDDVDGGDNG